MTDPMIIDKLDKSLHVIFWILQDWYFSDSHWRRMLSAGWLGRCSIQKDYEDDCNIRKNRREYYLEYGRYP